MSEKRKRYQEQSDRELRQERARARHARRVRNQVITYLTVGVFLVVMGVGLYAGTRRFVRLVSERRAAAELASEAEAAEAAEQNAEEGTAQILSPETVEDEVQPKSGEQLLSDFVDTVIADMPLEDKVAGLFLVTPEQLTGTGTVIQAGEATQEALRSCAVGGLVYSTQNIKSEEQVTQMLASTVGMSKYPIFLATMETGTQDGNVTRALSLDGVASPAELAESGDMGAARAAGEAIAERLRSLGFDVNFGTAVNLTSEAMDDDARALSFGDDASRASELLAEEIRGMEENGVHTMAKLFPTLPQTTEGKGIPSTGLSAEELAEGDFKMFATALEAGTRMVMVGNLAAPALTGDNTPCSLSQAVVTDALRGSLGFDGVVVTDAMDDETIREYYTSDQAAVAALKAGADLIYRPEDLAAAMQGVTEAVESGVLSESRLDESLRRIYLLKYADRAVG